MYRSPLSPIKQTNQNIPTDSFNRCLLATLPLTARKRSSSFSRKILSRRVQFLEELSARKLDPSWTRIFRHGYALRKFSFRSGCFGCCSIASKHAYRGKRFEEQGGIFYQSSRCIASFLSGKQLAGDPRNLYFHVTGKQRVKELSEPRD